MMAPGIAFSDLVDDAAASHLVQHHPDGMKLVPVPEPGRQVFRFRSERRIWDIYHDMILHKGEIMPAGKSIFEMMWDELDTVVSRLMLDGEGYEDQDKGAALGIATCLAIMINPYAPDIGAVRTEAMRRWEVKDES